MITAKVVFNGTKLDGHSLMGGDPDPKTWEEYKSQFNEDYQGHIQAARQAFEESGLIGCLAMEFCNNVDVEFSDNTSLTFSFRAWGDFMDAIIGKKEGYMAYY